MTEGQRSERVRLLALLAVVVVVVGSVAVWTAASDRSATSASSAPSSSASPARPSSSASATVAVIAHDLGALAIGGRVDGPVETLAGPGPMELAYEVEVSEPTGRLRATLDLSNRDDCLTLELLDPSGVSVQAGPGDYPVVCPHGDRSGQVFGIELGVLDAAVGRWRVRVRAEDVRDLRLRLRATLESPPAVGTGQALAPDLVPWLPWEFGFAAPDNAAPGTARDRDNGPGDPTVSCHPDEEPEATHCLRFSAGVYNVGDGPLSIVFEGDAAVQHVYLADATPLDHTDNERAGAYEDHLAGRGEWHEFHQHRHLASFVRYELFQDDGGTTKLIPLGEGGKHGYCTFSQQVHDWSSTAQDPQHASFPDGPFCDAAMTLERGWGDLYRWQRPGQYLSFADVAEPDGSMRAGRYLVRMTVDPDDHVVETDETNNVGDVVIDVIDGGGPGEDTVVVCEQGLGAGPGGTPVEPRDAWSRPDPGPECPAT
jgi:hypothetical protein